MVKESSKTLSLRNKSYTYLLPLLGDKSSVFKNCSGVFYKDNNKPEIKNKVLLLFRMNKEWSEKLHDWIKKLHLYNDFYKVDEEYSMYVFNLPEGYKKNYHLFIKGRYSEMDDEFKRHILKFHSDLQTNQGSVAVKQVLYRDEKLYQKWEETLDILIPRTQEISSIPDDKSEVFFTLQMLTDKNNN
jgi:hypothetical protein